MPTTDEVEDAISDLKRAQSAVDDLRQRKTALLAQVDAINVQLATERANVVANEAAAKAAALKFGNVA